MGVRVLISDPLGTKAFLPDIEGTVEWTTQRQGAPGTLSFHVIDDGIPDLSEGSVVQLHVDDVPVFFGFLFTKKRDRGKNVAVTAYDQLRYLKNKDTYVYRNKTASQFIKALADDFNLRTGELEDTGFVIASRREEDTALFDMIGNALDLTLTNTREMYVLYDDFGKLTLKSVANMYVGGPEGYLIIDEETAEDLEYTSSIDSDTYNKIKLTYENDETGKRDVYIAQHGENMNQWGILQYYETLSKGENGQAKADALLQLYNRKTRGLRIKGAFGDIRVRGGSLVAVSLDLGDMKLMNFMLVEKATHRFQEGEHRMDLTLRGGEFIV